jgi:ADP-heptose:LPS heptosyltransferase
VKILLIRRGAMGDILMSTPLIRQLRYNFPKAQIDYCLARSFKSALKDNPYLNNIILLADKCFTLKGIFSFSRFALSVRNHYDYVFILGKDWRFNLLSVLIGGVRIGYARESISQCLLTQVVKYNDVTRYHGLYFLDLLKRSALASPNYDDVALDLTITDNDKQLVNNILAQYKLNTDDFVVVTNSGGNNQYESGGIRMLPDDKMMGLIEQLANSYPVILLGGDGDKLNYTRYIDNFLANKCNSGGNNSGSNKSADKHFYPIINLAGSFNLPQSAWLIALARSFYTTDCGAMHLGIVVNAHNKMTCFFGPTHPKHVLPDDDSIKVVWQDQDLFDEIYPLRGKISHSRSFFRKLEF